MPYMPVYVEGPEFLQDVEAVSQQSFGSEEGVDITRFENGTFVAIDFPDALRIIVYERDEGELIIKCRAKNPDDPTPPEGDRRTRLKQLLDAEPALADLDIVLI